jgi:pyruvate dehydrogenase E1 component beta subunit
MRTAIASENPTVFLAHSKLLRNTGEVPDEDFTVPFGQAAVRRQGRDVTIVGSSVTVETGLAAAELLAADRVDAEVIDIRTIVPLDREAICASVRKTGRLVVVDECNRTCGVAAEIAATVAEDAFDALRSPIVRLTKPDSPVPWSAALETALVPSAAQVADAIRGLMNGQSRPRGAKPGSR